MNKKSLFVVSCVAATTLALSTTAARADARSGVIAQPTFGDARPSISMGARPAASAAIGRSAAPTQFAGRHWSGTGNGNGRWSGTGNGGRGWNGTGSGNGHWNGTGNGNGRWSGRGNWNGANHNGWRHHHHHFPRYYSSFYPYYWDYPWGWGYPYYGVSASYYYDANAYAYDGRGAGNLVAAVQQRLARGGYYRGEIDGVIGNGTRRAIRSYERSHGLPVDGRIDDQLLDRLGLS